MAIFRWTSHFEPTLRVVVISCSLYESANNEWTWIFQHLGDAQGEEPRRGEVETRQRELRILRAGQAPAASCGNHFPARQGFDYSPHDLVPQTAGLLASRRPALGLLIARPRTSRQTSSFKMWVLLLHFFAYSSVAFTGMWMVADCIAWYMLLYRMYFIIYYLVFWICIVPEESFVEITPGRYFRFELFLAVLRCINSGLLALRWRHASLFPLIVPCGPRGLILMLWLHSAILCSGRAFSRPSLIRVSG